MMTHEYGLLYVTYQEMFGQRAGLYCPDSAHIAAIRPCLGMIFRPYMGKR